MSGGGQARRFVLRGGGLVSRRVGRGVVDLVAGGGRPSGGLVAAVGCPRRRRLPRPPSSSDGLGRRLGRAQALPAVGASASSAVASAVVRRAATVCRLRRSSASAGSASGGGARAARRAQRRRTPRCASISCPASRYASPRTIDRSEAPRARRRLEDGRGERRREAQREPEPQRRLVERPGDERGASGLELAGRVRQLARGPAASGVVVVPQPERHRPARHGRGRRGRRAAVAARQRAARRRLAWPRLGRAIEERRCGRWRLVGIGRPDRRARHPGEDRVDRARSRRPSRARRAGAPRSGARARPRPRRR